MGFMSALRISRRSRDTISRPPRDSCTTFRSAEDVPPCCVGKIATFVDLCPPQHGFNKALKVVLRESWSITDHRALRAARVAQRSSAARARTRIDRKQVTDGRYSGQLGWPRGC